MHIPFKVRVRVHVGICDAHGSAAYLGIPLARLIVTTHINLGVHNHGTTPTSRGHKLTAVGTSAENLGCGKVSGPPIFNTSPDYFKVIKGTVNCTYNGSMTVNCLTLISHKIARIRKLRALHSILKTGAALGALTARTTR